MKGLANFLEKIYNTMGNKYLTENFDTEPFEFKVNVRRGNRNYDLHDWIVEVYSVPNMPKSFMYKKGKDTDSDGIDISVLTKLFKDYTKYFDTSFGEFQKTIGVKFMNRGY